MKNRAVFRLRACLIAIGVAFSCQLAHATPVVSGALENYFVAQSQAGSVSTQLYTTLLTGTVQFDPTTQITAGFLRYNGFTQLDENYVRFGAVGGTWRVGRFRTEFGHSDWAELYYNGLPNQPLIRSQYTQQYTGLPLDRIDTGLDYTTNSGPWQLQAAVIDPYSTSYDILPMSTRHVAIRAQTYVDNVILGFNVLTSTNTADNRGNGVKLYDIDYRWSVPSVQIRGEALDSTVGHQHSDGYYTDFSYHTLSLPNTTFRARVEGVRYTHWPQWESAAYTVGVRQVLGPDFTLEVAQTWGNHAEAVNQIDGTTLQLEVATPL